MLFEIRVNTNVEMAWLSISIIVSFIILPSTSL